MREDVKQSCVKKEIKKALDQFVHKKRDAKDHYFENPDDWTRNALHTQINGTKEEAIEKAKIKVEKEAIYTQNKSEVSFFFQYWLRYLTIFFTIFSDNIQAKRD